MATESIDEGPYIKDTYITDKLAASFLPLFQGRRVKTCKKDENFYSEDVIKKLSIVLADGIYVDILNLKPRIQNQIKRLAAPIGSSQELSI